jgi:hypothetical protein
MTFIKNAVLWIWNSVLFLLYVALASWHMLALGLILVFVVNHFWREIAANINEPEPSRFTMTTFPQTYQGQYWLKLSGRLAVRQTRMENLKGAKSPDAMTLFIPFVGPDWDVQQPVHAVVVFQPIEKKDLKDWLSRHPADIDCIVTGVVREHSFQKLFPELQSGSPLVFVHDKSEPQSVGSLLILGAVVLLIGFILWKIAKLGWRHGARKAYLPPGRDQNSADQQPK